MSSEYRYIGKDGKTVLARDLEDERDALKAQLEQLLEDKFGEPERVEVRLNDEGGKEFFVSTRDGCESLGVEIHMLAEHYAAGTCITLEEPLE